MATLFVGACLAGVFAAVLLAAVEVVERFAAEVFLAGEVFAGALRAVAFVTGSVTSFAALFLAAAVRWGAVFLGADGAIGQLPPAFVGD
jgi:hypothetical protein